MELMSYNNIMEFGTIWKEDQQHLASIEGDILKFLGVVALQSMHRAWIWKTCIQRTWKNQKKSLHQRLIGSVEKQQGHSMYVCGGYVIKTGFVLEDVRRTTI